VQELPEARRVISRRGLLLAGLASGCARPDAAVLADFRTFMQALPLQTAGKVPFEPWKLEGKVVLITFIATWCFPCLTELVVVNRLERDHSAQGFANVLVGMDLEGRLVLDPFAEGYKLTVPLIVADDRIRSGETVFGRIRELPSRILFGRSGALVVGFSGVSKYEDLERLVASEVSK
jgi:thiol-disulfide isomerase/thioredoxin